MSSPSMDMNMTNLSKNVALALSFYSPVIISTSMLIFSIFSGALGKGLFFIFWLLVVTAVRIFILWMIPSNTASVSQNKNPICAMGSFLPYDNGTYSTFILCFSFLYFTMPMYIANNINYMVILFFLVYILFDIFIKLTHKCVSSATLLFGDIVSGAGLSALIASLIYTSPIRSYLFINEISSNKEVCTMPSKQKFKCAVYKNGELVGSTTS
jgi:hypothetical protein